MVRAIGLFSGGLDSVLAACVLREQGIEVAGISFETPFFDADSARRSAGGIGIPLIVMDITERHLKMMEKPKYGFGSNMNPCIDCHALMVAVACGVMREKGFDFVFTGEVLNERPMSQNKRALQIVEKASGCEGRLLRPLSARLLDETVPEREGKVDRERLLALHGRSRKEQMALAKRYGIKEYVQPAGGCLLTDPGFSKRLRDLSDNEGIKDVRLINLLKVGRHFRSKGRRKMVVGRNAAENKRISELACDADIILRPRSVPGPTVLITGAAGEEDIFEAARLCARYSDAKPGEKVALARRHGGRVSLVDLVCPSPEELGMVNI